MIPGRSCPSSRLIILRALASRVRCQEVTVAEMPKRRGPGAEAQRCYAETAESLERKRLAAERRAAEPRIEAPTPGRPDKRTRRLLLRARHRAAGEPD